MTLFPIHFSPDATDNDIVMTHVYIHLSLDLSKFLRCTMSIPKPIDLTDSSFYLVVPPKKKTLNSGIQISNKKNDGAAMLCALEDCHASFTYLREKNITACWYVLMAVGHFIPRCLLSLQLNRDAEVYVIFLCIWQSQTSSVNNPAYIFGFFMSAWKKKVLWLVIGHDSNTYSKLTTCLEG